MQSTTKVSSSPEKSENRALNPNPGFTCAIVNIFSVVPKLTTIESTRTNWRFFHVRVRVQNIEDCREVLHRQ